MENVNKAERIEVFFLFFLFFFSKSFFLFFLNLSFCSFIFFLVSKSGFSGQKKIKRRKKEVKTGVGKSNQNNNKKIIIINTTTTGKEVERRCLWAQQLPRSPFYSKGKRR